MEPKKTLTRKCGDCSACCTVLSVEQIGKAKYIKCEHLRSGNRACGIYNDRPEACVSYTCGWLEGFGSNSDRPDRSGIVWTQEYTLLGVTLLGLETRKGAATSSNPVVQKALQIARQKNIGLIIGGHEFRKILHVPPGKELEVAQALSQARAEGKDLQVS